MSVFIASGNHHHGQPAAATVFMVICVCEVFLLLFAVNSHFSSLSPLKFVTSALKSKKMKERPPFKISQKKGEGGTKAPKKSKEYMQKQLTKAGNKQREHRVPEKKTKHANLITIINSKVIGT
jgi:hypothetical protein